MISKPIIPPSNDDVVFTKETCIVPPDLRDHQSRPEYKVPIRETRINDYVEDDFVKNELEEFTDKIRSDTYEKVDLDGSDVFMAKIKSFIRNEEYDIKNKDEMADNILELVLNMSLTILLSGKKLSDLTVSRRNNFVKLLEQVRNYINIKTLEIDENAEAEYLTLRNEILLTYVLSAI